MNRTIVVTIGAVAALLVVAFVGIWYLLPVFPALNTSQNTAYKTTTGLLDQTAKDNPSYVQGVQAERAGRFSDALSYFQSALSSAKDPAQTVAILFGIASNNEYLGNYAVAVRTLQQIVDTTSYSQQSRALAAEQLGLMYERYRNSVSQDIFWRPPYKDLYVSTSTNLTTRHLFQYAASIYPLPLSEYYIASTFAFYIASQQNAAPEPASTTAQVITKLTKKLGDTLTAGDAALAVIAADPPYPSYVPDAMIEKAGVLAQMEALGNTSFGSADQAYKDALAAYAAQQLTEDGSARLQYAYYLAGTYGATRAADVQATLNAIVTDPTHRGFLIVPILKGYANAPSSRIKRNLVAVSVIDPQFRNFLTALGWTSADFSTNAASSSAQ